MTVQACDTLDAVATQRPQECGDQHGRGDAALTQAELAGPSDAFEFGRRKELIEIVVGVDNGHGFVSIHQDGVDGISSAGMG